MQSTLTGFNNPHGMVTDYTGNLYVADTGNQRVLRIPEEQSGLNLADATSIGANLIAPIDVGVDPSGNVYIVDAGAPGANNGQWFVFRTKRYALDTVLTKWWF